MNGLRVIRTIAFDITVGSEVIVGGKTLIVRSFDLERQVVTLEVPLDDVFLKSNPLSTMNKQVKTFQAPIAKVVGTGMVTILNDKLLTIGDIPYGQGLSNN
ncbi:MAG: hypothetical protein HOG49_05585 [Candidatus Scalindua sp.]|jgi:hypothetical protein|nr:hypothetical protein [Candidatus Scalindua sp.]